MEEKKQVKLKDPQTFRVFISSPFNGMEAERETLAKLYWPRLESTLATRGLRLRLVDMRWGITQSSAINSQTINICLREVDRSDFFIGLYGQRYGWHGLHDENLQDNFDKAKDRFPWIMDHQDKSVTELEFRHGHLNQPATLPACFTFRDKKFDDLKIIEARKTGDTKREKAYSPDGSTATELLENLKKQVMDTEKQTQGVLSDYSNPDQAAEFIYNSVSKFVKNEIVSSSTEPPSKKEKSLLAHEIYMKSRGGKYIGGQKYFETLDKYISEKGESKPLVIVGKTGSGKSALIANWIGNLKSDKYENLFVVYHLVGAEPDSASTINLLIRLIENLQPEVTGEEFISSSVKHEEKELLLKLQAIFKELESDNSKSKKKIVIVVDKVDQMNRDKTSKPLYWLPSNLTEHMRVVLTVTSGHEGAEEILETLEESYKALKLEVNPLTDEDKWSMCQMLLDEYSKSMDEEQLNLIVSSPKSSQPFFLSVLIQELCVSGKFRELTRQIKLHLDSDGVTGLLCRVLKRVEEDYQNDEAGGNLAEEVLCAISLCKKGIAEAELPMPQHVWAPLIYAMEKYLINKGGLLSFAFPEMKDAVELLYMNTKEKKQGAAKRLSDIFYVPFKESRKNKERTLKKRLALELPYLLKVSGEKEKLMEVMSDIKVFEVLFESGRYDLNEYWRYLGVPADVIARRLLRSLDCYTADRYAYYLRAYNEEAIIDLMRWKSDIIDNIRRWMDIIKLYHGLDLIYDREILIDERRPGLTDIKRENLLVQVRYFKACFLSDIEKYHESLSMHKEVLEGRRKLVEAKIMEKEDIGMSYHGIGLCYYNLKEHDEAEKWFNMALEAQSEENSTNATSNANTYCNLGLIAMARTDYEKSMEYFEKSNALWEKVMPDRVCLDMAYNYHNMAMVNRKQKNYDEAERIYFKSLKLKERLLGRESYDVAITLMNLGTVETYRKNNEKSLEYNKQSLAIFKKLAPEGSYRTMMAEENVVNQLTMLDRYEEAEPFFQNVLRHLKTMEGGSANGLAPLHRRFRNWYEEKGYKAKALDVSNGLISCSKCKPADVAYHIILYNDMAEAEKGQCIPEGTFEAGIAKWPNDREILMGKLAVLIESSQDELMTFFRKFCEESTGQPQGGRYLLVCDIIKVDLEDIDLAIKVATVGVEYEPENEELKNKLEQLKSERSASKEAQEKTDDKDEQKENGSQEQKDGDQNDGLLKGENILEKQEKDHDNKDTTVGDKENKTDGDQAKKKTD